MNPGGDATCGHSSRVHAAGCALVVALAIFMVTCSPLWLDTYWRSERYVLLAVDSRPQMSLSFDLQDGTAVGLVGPTVFAIGSNDVYIVVKQHPSTDRFGRSFDRTITNYYIVRRTHSAQVAERQKGVRGPMAKADFDQLQTALHLPPFTTTFDDLQ